MRKYAAARRDAPGAMMPGCVFLLGGAYFPKSTLRHTPLIGCNLKRVVFLFGENNTGAAHPLANTINPRGRKHHRDKLLKFIVHHFAVFCAKICHNALIYCDLLHLHTYKIALGEWQKQHQQAHTTPATKFHTYNFDYMRRRRPERCGGTAPADARPWNGGACGGMKPHLCHGAGGGAAHDGTHHDTKTGNTKTAQTRINTSTTCAPCFYSLISLSLFFWFRLFVLEKLPNFVTFGAPGKCLYLQILLMDLNEFLPVETDAADKSRENVNTSFADLFNIDGVAPVYFDARKKYEKPPFVFSLNGKRFAPLQGLVSVTGQSGHGKSMLFTLFAAAALCGRCGPLTYENPHAEPPRVLYIDTEMIDFAEWLIVWRLTQLTGMDVASGENFRIAPLRGISDLKTRWKMVFSCLRDFRPHLIIFDGVLDLIREMNDSAESELITRGFMEMATNLNAVVMNVLHQNPGRDEKMAGHIGSYMERKNDDVFSVKRHANDKGETLYFEVTPLKNRFGVVPKVSFDVIEMECKENGETYGVPRFLSEEMAATFQKPNPPADPVELARQTLPGDGHGIDVTLWESEIKTRYGLSATAAKRLRKQAATCGAVEIKRSKTGGDLYSLKIGDVLPF